MISVDDSGPPDPPPALAMEIVGSDSVCLRFSEPEDQNLAVCTKVKAQWSPDENFCVILGEKEVLDIRARQLTVTQLSPGSRCFFRLACGNIKGYSPYVNAQPSSGVPSAWRDVDGQKPRFLGKCRALDDLFEKLLSCRPADASEIRDMEHNASEDEGKRVQKKSTIKQFFTAAPKFEKEKLLKRGLHLACIFYNEDKILVTNEEHLPIVEVDENSPPGPLHTDYNWLTKVACTWKDVKTLRQDMEKLSTSPQIELRSKILSAVTLFQGALGIQELGQLYYQHLRDGCGTVLISSVNQIKNPKNIQSLSVKWIPMNKLQRKSASIGGGSRNNSEASCSESEPTVGDLLLSTIHDQILYDQRSRVALPAGLYLGYIKLQSSMDLLSILVPERTPNIFPHIKIRDNNHVSGEEWEWLQSLSKCQDDGILSAGGGSSHLLDIPSIFERQIAVALKKLFAYLGVADSRNAASSHRIYIREVLEVSPEVSFIMVLPLPENVCSIPGQTHELLTERRDFISVPVSVFEMAHLRTYQREFVSRYCRLFSILELDQSSAQQANREAFSRLEVDAARKRIVQLQEVQSQLDNTWKGARWIMDILSYARDKSCPSGSLSTATLLARHWATPITTDTSALIPTSFSSSSANTENNNPFRVKNNPASSQDHWPPAKTLPPPPPKEKNLFKSHTASSINVPPSHHHHHHQHHHHHHHKKPGELEHSNSLVVPADGSETLHVSSESLFLVPTVAPGKSAGRIVSGGGGGGGHQPLHPGATLNQSHSENSLMVPKGLEATLTGHQVSSSRKVSAPDCLEEAMGKSFQKADENVAKKKKYSLDVGAPQPPATGLLYRHLMQPEQQQQQQVTKQQQPSVPYPESEQSAGSSCSASLRSLSSNEETENVDVLQQGGPDEPSVLQVYAAYKTGLAAGTSVKLHVTSQTSAREVVDLVVQQLNMAVVLKGKGGPVYSVEQLKDFCLVAVIGARERCLRDDFQPLKLQNPWRKGRLFVRKKGDVLAALQHGHVSPQTSYL
ncbi:unnamed protein product [Notodromas monacha]|uniref:Ankyrin repeat and fibronectin type-III domain-containing protein 1 n=1 Tax=Notodromas monacha TaxID=399045 RepID=A0A7R9BWB1_9CRUS|nr:unnamed protein product [Notodromas monacha]CAG0921584.1 unnamed protein product [Notodromas monacha]